MTLRVEHWIAIAGIAVTLWIGWNQLVLQRQIVDLQARR